MKQWAVIVDFSHLYHVCKSAALRTPPEYDLKEVTLDNVIGKLRTLKKELANLGIRGYDLVFVEDRPALRKLALLPTYKHGHADTHIEKQDVKEFLLQKGHITRFCWSEGNEADDAIATVVKLVLAQEDLSCVICSGDRDLWQLIQPRVIVVNPVSYRKSKEKKEALISLDDVTAAFCCQPIHIPLVKALWGDAGDCVPNVVPRTQKSFLSLIIQSDGSLDSFKKIVDENRWYIKPKAYQSYLDNIELIERNYALVKLQDDCELNWE